MAKNNTDVDCSGATVLEKANTLSRGFGPLGSLQPKRMSHVKIQVIKGHKHAPICGGRGDFVEMICCHSAACFVATPELRPRIVRANNWPHRMNGDEVLPP